MTSPRCAYCFGPLNLARAGAKFCSQKCGTYYRRRTLPKPLTLANRWVVRDARKRPLDARTGRYASVSDPLTWCSYKEAKASPYGVGIGFVLTADDDVSCVDLDGVLEDGVMVPGVRELIAGIPGVFMVEVSVSGKGLHVWHHGENGPGTNRDEGGIRVERYSQGRYLAVTGLRTDL